MPWPWQSAHEGNLGFCCLPMRDVLALVACLNHGGLAHGCYLELLCVALPWLLPHCYFHDLGTWACHGLGSMPMVVALALPTCPLEGYFSKKGFFIYFFIFILFFSNEVIWVGQHTLAFVAFLWGLPWPLLHDLAMVALLMGAALILAVCVPLPWLLTHEDYHGLKSMYVGIPWPWEHSRVISQMRVLSKRRVFFFFPSFSPFNGGYLGRLACLGLPWSW